MFAMTNTATIAATVVAMIAFAGNSVLCRWALGTDQIDPASFTLVRLVSGIVMLLVLYRLTHTGEPRPSGSWMASSMLFFYAIAFSYAYVLLDTATGALILFVWVQITMIGMGMLRREFPTKKEWSGVAITMVGFLFLIGPDVTSPSLVGFGLMSCAGIAWGMYTIKGRTSEDPLADTAMNFLRTTPLLIVPAALMIVDYHFTMTGLMLAGVSGALASGVGYAVWYVALKGLGGTQAAVSQLSVPIIAAIGGLIFVGEPLDLHLMIAAALTLGGILIVTLGRARPAPAS